MNKKFVAILGVWVVVSCNKIDPIITPSVKVTELKMGTERRGFKVTQNDALQVALEVSNRFSPATKSEARIVLNSFPILDNAPKRSRSALVDTLVYVVNFAENQGYVFVSPDIRTGEVLAYFESGNFQIADTIGNQVKKFMVDLILEHQILQLNEIMSMPNDMPASYIGLTNVPGPLGIIQIPAEEIYVGMEGNPQAIEFMRRKYPNLEKDRNLGLPTEPPMPSQPEFPLGPPGPDHPDLGLVFDPAEYYATKGCTYITSFRREKHGYKAPMVKTKWSQYSPLNWYVSIIFGARPPVGCGPLAAAQIMVYHKYPTHIPDQNNLKFRGEDIYMAQLDQHVLNINLSNAPIEVKNGGAKLLRALGDAMDIIYTDAFGSGVPSLALSGGDKIIKTFERFGYRVPLEFHSYSAGNMAILRKSLDEGKPVFVYGFSNKVHSNGHVWVIDGYQDDADYLHHKRYLFDEYGTFNAIGNGSIAWARDDRFVHCNMGGGADIYTTNTSNNSSIDCWFNGYVFDRTSNSGGNYRYNIRFLPGITKP